MSTRRDSPTLTAEGLLRAYAQGWFPMLHDDGQHYWHDPDPRAVFPLNDLRPDRTARRLSATGAFNISINRSFGEVMRACADTRLPGREETWISEAMIEAYTGAHRMGHAASVEVWREEDRQLVGGIYGIHIGGAFFGESMFSRISGASRMAFDHLRRQLRAQGFVLFDTQYLNAHTRLLGAVEIPRSAFRKQLEAALSLPVGFTPEFPLSPLN